MPTKGPLANLSPEQRRAQVLPHIRTRDLAEDDPYRERIVEQCAVGYRRDLPIGGSWRKEGHRWSRAGLSQSVAALLSTLYARTAWSRATRRAVAELWDGESWRLVGWALFDGPTDRQRLLWAYVIPTLQESGIFGELAGGRVTAHAVESTRAKDWLRRLGTQHEELALWADPRNPTR